MNEITNGTQPTSVIAVRVPTSERTKIAEAAMRSQQSISSIMRRVLAEATEKVLSDASLQTTDHENRAIRYDTPKIRISVDLTVDEQEALVTKARQERRNPRDQAAIEIRQGLERAGYLQLRASTGTEREAQP